MLRLLDILSRAMGSQSDIGPGKRRPEPFMRKVAMKILGNFIVLGTNCKFINAFYDILKDIDENVIESIDEFSNSHPKL
jgi:hypothetical protein